MWKQNIKLFFRSIKKSKSVFLINILGLTGGLAAALLIFLWVTNELKVNQFSEIDSDRHVQVMVNYHTPQTIETEDITPGPLTLTMAEDIAEIDYAVPVVAPRSFYNGVLSNQTNNIKVKPQFVGDGFFKIFGCDFIAGSKKNALTDRQSIVISETMALSLFNSGQNALGKTVTFRNEYFDGSYTVTGVFKLPKNTSDTYDVLFSFERFLEGRPNLKKWNNGGVQAHLVLLPEVSISEFNIKIDNYLESKIQGANTSLFAQKYKARYLFGSYENGIPAAGRMKFVGLFGIIGLLILALACINFSNLATANAAKRIKEIGIKKAAGVKRTTLLLQFMTEAVLMSLLALMVAVPVVKIVLPIFNEIIGTKLTFDFGYRAVIGVLTITVATGLISGIYPAVYLSKLKPVQTLKGKLNVGRGEFWLRKGLVIFQFSISIVLLIAVLVVSKQVGFVQEQELGYDKEQVVSFPIEGNLDTEYKAFITEIEQVVGVSKASHMYGDLPGRLGNSTGYQWADQEEGELKIRFFDISGGYDIIDLLDVEVIEGRSFLQNSETDREGIIFNETAIKTMGYEDNPIGQQVYFEGYKTIVGIVKDFHFESLYEPIKPLFFELGKGDNIMVKLDAKQPYETIAKIETIYKKFNPNTPFEYRFIDDNFQEIYRSEQIVTLLSKYFAGLAIIISCLGLFGLALFTAFQRRKEISIRKILGQNMTQIVVMLSKDFALLVVIAIFIAVPIAYLLSTDWLSDFAYRISLNLWYFVGAATLALAVALVTIGGQAIFAANRNPINALREE